MLKKKYSIKYNVLLIQGEEVLKRNKGQYALLVIEIRALKKIKETLGYGDGNKVLETIIRKVKFFYIRKEKYSESIAN